MSGPGGQSNVDIDAQQVSDATSQLDATASSLRAAWDAASAAIAGLNNAGTWGTDPPGQAFEETYSQGGGTDHVGRARAAVTDTGEFGPDVRTAVQNSLAADEVQAAQVHVDVRGL